MLKNLNEETQKRRRPSDNIIQLWMVTDNEKAMETLGEALYTEQQSTALLTDKTVQTGSTRMMH